MKLTSNRLYLDYNSTSPLAESVMEFLARGDFSFGNPSSLHTSGKKALSVVTHAKSEILDLFGVTEGHNLFFHSGATEGINTILKGVARASKKEAGESIHFFYSPLDHACVINLKDEMQFAGHKVYQIEVDENGNFDDDVLIERINSLGEVPVLLNYTWVNNETGVVWDLDRAAKIKKMTNCLVHVDSSQAPGKVIGWDKMSSSIDAYTFSGHKFGALKGIGFSVYRNSFAFAPLMAGGGQQDGVRPGTHNTLGIQSLLLAIRELKQTFSPEEMQRGKQYFEDALKELLAGRGEIVAESAARSLNTTGVIVHGVNSDILLAALDIAGIEVSAGSACSSGNIVANRVLMNMGVCEADAKSFLRISFGFDFCIDYAKNAFEKIGPVLSRFLDS